MASKYSVYAPYAPMHRVHIVPNNTKVWAYIVNLLAGHGNCNGRTLCGGSCEGCDGTCGFYGICYAMADTRFDNALEAQSDNTQYCRDDPHGFWQAVRAEMMRHTRSKKALRIHGSGTHVSPQDMYECFEALKDIPQESYVYTKRWAWVNTYIAEHDKPRTTIMMSAPFVDTWAEVKAWADKDNPNKLPMFIVDKGMDETIAKIPHCPAVGMGADGKPFKTGCRCGKDCTRCIDGKTTAVYLH